MVMSNVSCKEVSLTKFGVYQYNILPVVLTNLQFIQSFLHLNQYKQGDSYKLILWTDADNMAYQYHTDTDTNTHSGIHTNTITYIDRPSRVLTNSDTCRMFLDDRDTGFWVNFYQ